MTKEEYQHILQSSGTAGLDILCYNHGKLLTKIFETYDKIVPLIDDNNSNYFVVVTKGDGKCFENSVCANDNEYEYQGINLAKEINNIKHQSIEIQLETYAKQGMIIDRECLESSDGMYWAEDGIPHPLELKKGSLLSKLFDSFPFTLTVIDGDGCGRSYVSNGGKDCSLMIYLKNYHFSRMISKELFFKLHEEQKENAIPFIILNWNDEKKVRWFYQ